MRMMNLAFMVVLTIALLSYAALASSGHDSHGNDHSKTTHEVSSETKHHDDAHGTHGEHSGMTADGSMIIVGSQVSKGVKGMAHIKDVSAAMAKMGMKATHHFMMAFVDEQTGKQIEKGTVALKLTNPDAKVSETIELIGMDGHFGADIVLDMQGEYHFKLGTKLEDGTKRKYHFHYVNK